MYALVIVSCLASSMVANEEVGGYEQCFVAIPKVTTYATAVECQAMVNAAADASDTPPDRRVFLFCIGDS